MKVVILAGGYGTRLSEVTSTIPKHMVELGHISILLHIMGIYAKHGYKDFFVALGYGAGIIKDYFTKLSRMKSDYIVNLKSGLMTVHKEPDMDWNVTLVDTDLDTVAGGRIKRLKDYISDDDFLLTYGDGTADVEIAATIELHNSHNKLVTMTAAQPAARFSELDIEDNVVGSFEEKTQLHQGWINGGFFVCCPEVINYIEGGHEMFEREPPQKIIKGNEIAAYKHEGFRQCMVSKRDHENLNDLWDSGLAPWV
tara:strand:+ start:2405 stop:3166 length:762 start_codon:yes stop_codon:yes gene_type:complete